LGAISEKNRNQKRPGCADRERVRLGRELHDSTSQFLVAAELGLAALAQTPDISPQNRRCLDDARESLKAAQREIRAFAYFLHQPDLGGLPLGKALEQFCEGFARRSGLVISVSIDVIPMQLPMKVERALFRVCQEAVMNVYRHANAKHVRVCLAVTGDHIIMEVRDDGRGADCIETPERCGIGIPAMRARMAGVAGNLNMRNMSPGIAVMATVPIVPPHHTRHASRACGSAPGKRDRSR
jgi:signal transduction histidine kinase